MDAFKKTSIGFVVGAVVLAGIVVLLCLLRADRHEQESTGQLQHGRLDGGLARKPAVEPAQQDKSVQVVKRASPADSKGTDLDLEVLSRDIYTHAEGAADMAAFNSKYSDPCNFVRLEWFEGMSYTKACQLITKDKLPVLYQILGDRDYAPYWHNVAQLIGYVSDDPNSVPPLIRYFQQDDHWNWTSVDRGTAHNRFIGKLSALVWVGKNGADQADTILRDAITEEGAIRLAAAWLEKLPDPRLLETREDVIGLIRGCAAKGLILSGKPENTDIVTQFYATAKAERANSALLGQLMDAMAMKDCIADHGLESYFNMMDTARGIMLILDYLGKCKNQQ